MELFDEEFNEVCAKFTVVHFMRKGFTLNPKEIKREIHNRAKEWNLPIEQVAKAHKVLTSFLFQESMQEIDEIIKSKVEK